MITVRDAATIAAGTSASRSAHNRTHRASQSADDLLTCLEDIIRWSDIVGHNPEEIERARRLVDRIKS